MFSASAEQTIDTGEARIYLRSAGRGPAVVLLHGFPERRPM